MGNTNIHWTDKTWNPIRGCSLVSPGCTNCYAMATAARFSKPGQPYEGLADVHNGHPVWTGTIRFVTNHLEDPIHWRKPARVFVNSMSDLFHPDVHNDWIDQIWRVMELCPHHQFQILTKRPARMRTYTRGRMPEHHPPPTADLPHRLEPWPHIWLGTSVEDQRRADERIPILLDTHGSIHFISAEPLLGPINLAPWLGDCPTCHGDGEAYGIFCWDCHGTGFTGSPPRHDLDWVITGAESGPHRRHFDPQWARDIRDQCAAADVAFFHKQGAGLRPGQDRLLDGRLHEQYPPTPAHTHQP